MLKFNDDRRFSFLYDRVPAYEILGEPEVMRERNETHYVYKLSDGLIFTHILREFSEFSAYEWVNCFEYTGEGSSGVISELYDCDISIPFGHAEPDSYTAYIPDQSGTTKIYAPRGGENVRDAFYCDPDALNGSGFRYENQLFAGQSRRYATSGGRSSNRECAPFFNISQSGHGVVAAIGWTGQWNCEVGRDSENLHIKSKIEDTEFRMYKGERFRTSSFVIMEYDGDFSDGQNKWRRLVKSHFSLIGREGRPDSAPFCAGIWGGMNTSSALERIDAIRREQLPFEYIWMDAGWYGGDEVGASPDEYEGDWYRHTGDWRTNAAHPDGLLDVARAIHDAGMKFLLWFEPERVLSDVPIAKEHPEYLIKSPYDGDMNNLLDLGRDDAWRYCFDTIASHIERLGLDCYRQDFNFEPLGFWRSKDAPDRKGITEIKHINGLYRLWDALLERFPHLIIDNCASGGRRIDVETLRRSIPLWRNDAECPANYYTELNQSQNMSYNNWMPYSGSGSGRVWGDSYIMRGAYSASMTTNYTFSERDVFGGDREQLDWIRRYGDEYLRVRPYMSCDFYPLSEIVAGLDAWLASEFNRPEEGDGILLVFIREKSPYKRAVYRLRGLLETADYIIRDADEGSEIIKSGAELMKSGFEVETDRTRCAKLYFYHKA